MDFIPPDNPYAFVPWLGLLIIPVGIFVFAAWGRAEKALKAAGKKASIEFAFPWVMALNGLLLLSFVPLGLHHFWLGKVYEADVASVLIVAAEEGYQVQIDEEAAVRLLTAEMIGRYGRVSHVPLNLHPDAGEVVSGLPTGVLFRDGMYRAVQLQFDGEEWILVEPATVNEAVELTAP